jgi:hypothetical protein
MNIRRPAVAGQFYPGDPAALRDDLQRLTGGRTPPPEPRALALMVPHAGYMYSGPVAGATYTAARLVSRVVILCPNHTGVGEPIALYDDGAWDTPLGMAPVDAPLARAILKGCSAARVDATAHRGEHSLEVQVPFLQHLLARFSFVPICVGTLHLPTLLALGRAVAAAIAETAEEAVVIISSDMSHYLPADLAERRDRRALDRMLALDPEGLHRTVLEEDISMCGIAPATAGLQAARLLGARSARLVAYSNSGEATGDFGSVVAYAGVVVV